MSEESLPPPPAKVSTGVLHLPAATSPLDANIANLPKPEPPSETLSKLPTEPGDRATVVIAVEKGGIVDNEVLDIITTDKPTS